MKLEISAIGSQPAEAFSLSQSRTTIGRDDENDIVIDSRIMSGTHAQILRNGDGRFSVEDLGSVNGTFVNGEQVTGSSIKSGDQLKFGNIEATLADSEDSPESNQPEPNDFGSLAMSRAREAMEKLKKGLPSGSSQPVTLKSEAADSGDAADDDAPAETVTPDPAEAPATESEKPSKAPEKIPAGSAQLSTAGVEKDPKIDAPPAVADAAAGKAEDSENGLRLELAETKQERDRLKNRLRKQAAEIEAFWEQRAEDNRDRTEMETAMSELRAQVGQVIAERDALAADAEKLEQAAAETDGHRAELDTANSELRAQLERVIAERDELASTAEKWQHAEAENARLRAELAPLGRVHEEVAAAHDQLGAIQQEKARLQQEIESYQPQRAQLQQELADFLVQAEADKAAILAENAEVMRDLVSSQDQLKALNQHSNALQQEEDARRATVLSGIRELEQQQIAERADLEQIEEQKAAAEKQRHEIALSTEALKSTRRDIESQIAKREKALLRLHRKIERRKKLLTRLKTVARREREVKKRIEAGKRFLEAEEAHRSGGNGPLQVQPWDVDRALAIRDQAIEEARKIQENADQLRAAFEEKQRDLERLETRIRKQAPNPFRSAI